MRKEMAKIRFTQFPWSCAVADSKFGVTWMQLIWRSKA